MLVPANETQGFDDEGGILFLLLVTLKTTAKYI